MEAFHTQTHAEVVPSDLRPASFEVARDISCSLARVLNGHREPSARCTCWGREHEQRIAVRLERKALRLNPGRWRLRRPALSHSFAPDVTGKCLPGPHAISCWCRSGLLKRKCDENDGTQDQQSQKASCDEPRTIVCAEFRDECRHVFSPMRSQIKQKARSP